MKKLLLNLCVGFLCAGCGPREDPLLSALGLIPVHDETLVQGADRVRNLIFVSNADGLFSEIVGKLEGSGLLAGGRKDAAYSGELFLLDSMASSYPEARIREKVAFVFDREETALIVYDAGNWVLVEVVTW